MSTLFSKHVSCGKSGNYWLISCHNVTSLVHYLQKCIFFTVIAILTSRTVIFGHDQTAGRKWGARKKSNWECAHAPPPDHSTSHHIQWPANSMGRRARRIFLWLFKIPLKSRYFLRPVFPGSGCSRSGLGPLTRCSCWANPNGLSDQDLYFLSLGLHCWCYGDILWIILKYKSCILYYSITSLYLG